jgi:hypothetical protein
MCVWQVGGRRKMNRELWWGGLKKSSHFEDVGIGGSILVILKCM